MSSTRLHPADESPGAQGLVPTRQVALRVGWFCAYTPEELILAAGLQPVRLFGDFAHEDRVKVYYASAVCPYLRSALGGAIGTTHGPLVGVVVANACDGLRRLADVWARYLSPQFVYVLDVPRSADEAAVRYFATCLRRLRRFLEQRTARPIPDEALAEAIVLQNRVRRALTALAERRRDDGAIPARVFYDLVRRAATEPRAEFVEWVVSQLAGSVMLSEAKHLVALPNPGSSVPARRDSSLAALAQNDTWAVASGLRLALAGNVLAPADYGVLDLLEESGARVVADDLCTGERYFREEVCLDGDLLVALARRYLERTPCARMTNAAERFDRLVATCRETKADGVLYLSQKFCDASLYDYPALRASLEAEGIRAMLLELDASQGALGQARTRLQAFLETL